MSKKKHCKNCKKEITTGSKLGRCKRCAKLGKRNSNYDNHKLAGKRHPNWQGGAYINSYRYLYSPNHPYKTFGNYVAEHRLIMEKGLGRYLKPTEIVHYIDNNKLHNEKSNLLLFDTQGIHRKFHWNIYNFIIEEFGTKVIKKYIKWFKDKVEAI